ncbi:GFA family protein [Pseudoroseicyclus tamaricis]|uniref:GFA family protein n=1 Tax=Pseudoroseicyclus tamaricis TaxID=2705421 RepID=A0A6B2JMS4_9RHOB|nr:GFA family protein [Pseudoroseicyclus tamaricis]NDV02903.1 GFA family protein [Pseudoroseicyclus tamaricis]
MSARIEGRCLCGAVTMTATPGRELLFACHCSLCRHWTGGVFVGFSAPEAGVVVEGPVRRFRSSSFGERASCETCGAPLWFREDGGDYEFAIGQFPAASGWPLNNENYVDAAPDVLRLAGDHKRLSAAEYEAAHPHTEAV